MWRLDVTFTMLRSQSRTKRPMHSGPMRAELTRRLPYKCRTMRTRACAQSDSVDKSDRRVASQSHERNSREACALEPLSVSAPALVAPVGWAYRSEPYSGHRAL